MSIYRENLASENGAALNGKAACPDRPVLRWLRAAPRRLRCRRRDYVLGGRSDPAINILSAVADSAQVKKNAEPCILDPFVTHLDRPCAPKKESDQGKKRRGGICFVNANLTRGVKLDMVSFEWEESLLVIPVGGSARRFSFGGVWRGEGGVSVPSST